MKSTIFSMGLFAKGGTKGDNPFFVLNADTLRMLFSSADRVILRRRFRNRVAVGSDRQFNHEGGAAGIAIVRMQPSALHPDDEVTCRQIERRSGFRRLCRRRL